MKNYRNIRRVLSLLLVFALLIPYIGMSARSADIPCVEDGCSGKYRNGICSVAGHLEAAPLSGGVYQISNAGQLFWFAEQVNSGDDDCDAALTADITINADMSAKDKLQWTPIGLYTSAREYVSYNGTFDGAGYTIYGLYYEDTAYTGRNAGFIGTLGQEGRITNLTLADSVIIGSTEIGGIVSHNYGEILGCTQSGTVAGTGATGGIVCRNMGLLLNCINTGSVTGATTGGVAAENNGDIVSCDNFGEISGTNSVGGIVGMNDGVVSESVNTGSVTAAGTHAGGVVGNLIGGEVASCANTGAVTGASDYIGGLAGACLGASITSSYNAGNVSGAEKSEAVGGLVGAIDGTNTADSSITSCYNLGSVSGRSWVGGIAGISGYQKTPEGVTISECYTVGSVAGSSQYGAVVGALKKGNVSHTYYLTGSASNTVSGAIAATAEQFASGEIAAKLNDYSNVWYQNLDLEGVEPDAYPVLDPTHGVLYYGYKNCTEMGYTNRENYNESGDHVDEDHDNVCDKCEQILGEVHEHEFGEWARTKEPTCSEYGTDTRICSICNYHQNRQVEKAPHTEEIIPGTPATFEEPGVTDGVKCAVCGEILVYQETAPVRDYNEGIIPLNVLNISCGDYERNGGSSEGPAELAVDNNLNTIWHTDWYGTSRENHWFQFEITEDYTVDGLRYKPRIAGNTNGIITQYDILVSDDGVNFTSVASGNWAGDRTWKVVEFDGINVKYVRLVALDALTDNAYVFACAAEIRLTGEKAGAHLHNYEAVVTAPTCTEAGYTTYTCSCGDSYVADEVAALGHTASEAVKENEKAPTCTAAGSYDSVVYCSVCNAEIFRETVSVAALGHTEEIIPAVEATCTTDGLTEGKKCAVCNEILVAQEVIPALGHDWKGTGCTKCDATRENPFTDVPEDSFFIDPVLWAVEKGITTGTTATTFDPNGTCLRGHVVTFLWRAMGSPEPETTANPFDDVKPGDYFYKAVLWAYENGITTGIDATHFDPTGVCNRAQVVTFLWRAMGKPDSTAEVTFSDVVAGQFYSTAVAWAVEKGITNGMGDGTFGVLSNCNRAQVVTFLYRTLA